MRVRAEFRAQVTEEAGEVAAVAQPRVLGLGLSGGAVEVSAVEFVQLVEVARVEIAAEVAKLQLAVERA